MSTRHSPADAAEIKNCCAAAYGNDAVALLLGESYHPGGQALTERLADALDLRAGQHVVDVAAGPGATARLLATQRGVHVDGIELNQATVDKARATTENAGLGQTVRFHTGDAERIPLADAEFDAVVCECAFCTFPDKPTAAREFARVLRPGGRVGITDITVHPDGLPTELTGLAGWVACIADARPLDDYIAILDTAGLRTTDTQSHDEALRSMIDMMEARLKLLRMTAPDQLVAAGIDVNAVLHYTRLAADAAATGTLGYALITAEKPR
ncbi:class I SAM-dependent methyltransferase [Pseudonocardia sp. C8]|uniref:Class I SAM-dependent methyltransferase n=1 Tax=Saccharopolyspora cebuensis TaxID=418759 RepID=A0ABV4CBH6_9PSEU|nr:methyltransferase domain-containing protein [Pseudonocardia sp. C8]MBC3193925.1 class I SAM-dependent methyltransferase [Pseudonocardia sp. C8]